LLAAPTRMKAFALTALTAGFYILHQDVWNWRDTTPLVFGFLPIGLAYHAGYSLCAAGVMAVLVKYAWPQGLDPDEGRDGTTTPHDDQQP
jgi:hypothetical protein